MTPHGSTRFAEALRSRALVAFTRKFEKGSVIGYVLGIGPRFFLVAVVNDGIWFDGFQCCRMSDVRKLQVPAKYAAFHESALEKRGEHMPKQPRVSVASTERLLLSANRTFPLVTIYREQMIPTCAGSVASLRSAEVACSSWR